MKNAWDELIPWEKLQGSLPAILQSEKSGEVVAVRWLAKNEFEGPVVSQWVNGVRPFAYGDHAHPAPIVPHELYLDCDADCLLVKASVSEKTEERALARFQRELPLSYRDHLVLTVAQDALRKDVLMVAFMNEEAMKLTLETRIVHYFSRKRKKLWRKGEESGNVQHLCWARFSLSGHLVVLQIQQQGGAACHEGYRTCFFRKFEKDGSLSVIGERLFDPKQVYKM